MNYLFKDDKRKSITFALLTLAVLFLGSYELPILDNLIYILGSFVGSLLWGLIVGFIYMYLISKQQRSIWQKVRIIMFITFLAACINSIPRMISSFILGYMSVK